MQKFTYPSQNEDSISLIFDFGRRLFISFHFICIGTTEETLGVKTFFFFPVKCLPLSTMEALRLSHHDSDSSPYFIWADVNSLYCGSSTLHNHSNEELCPSNTQPVRSCKRVRLASSPPFMARFTFFVSISSHPSR